MRGIKLLPLLISALFSEASLADPVGQARLKLDGGLQLQFQPGDDNGAAFLDAEQIETPAPGQLFASGKAQLRRRGVYVFADELRYWADGEQIQASGNVRAERFGNVVWSDELKLRQQDSTGYADNARYQLQLASKAKADPFDPLATVRGAVPARGSASRILFEGQGKYRRQDSSFTTCEPGRDDWFIKTGDLELDFNRNVGVAKHSTVDFLGVPIAYAPWMDFSLDGSRKSGILPPTFGSTSNSGTELTVPFYWNMAPNYDWEIAPRMMSKRGVAFNNLFRYMEPGAVGEIRAEWLPDDRIADTNRYSAELKHAQVFSPNWSGTLQLQKVSDDNYFTELSNRVSSTSLVNLPRIGTLTYAQPDWSLTGRVERYQTLQDPLAPVTAPYFREPQLLFNGNTLGVGGSELAMLGEYVSFGHPTLVNGKRSMLYPNVALPLQTHYAYITPKVGYSYTRYDMAANPATGADKVSYGRSLPIVSVDSSLFLERDDSWFGSAFVQTLEPRLYYLYIPYRDQSMLPNFDSSEMDLNFAQLFTENQFAGYDRINNANQLTAAITSRFLENATGRERLRFSLGQRYYFADQKVTLNNPVRKSNSSDLLLGLGGQLADSVSAEGNWQYNQSDEASERFNVDLRYRPSLGKAFNVSYRFERQMYRQVDVSAQWPVWRNWWGVGRMAYSLNDSKTLEALAGLEYNAGCWMVRVGGQRFVTDVDKMSSGYLIQLELTDIARVGTNALEVLSRSIPGYGKITVDRPVRGSEIYR